MSEQSHLITQGVQDCDAGQDETTHHGACAREVDGADTDPERLQRLLDDAMSRLAGAFSTLADDAAAARHPEARDALVSTLQYHDICSQLIGHARKRLASSKALLEGEVKAEDFVAHSAGPVRQADMAPGAVDLF